MVSVSAKKSVARYLISSYQVSERRACNLAQLARKTYRYTSIRPPQDALRRRIRELAQTRIRYGYKRIHVLLRREGARINHKRVHRLYCEEGLQIRSKRPRRNLSAAHRKGKIQATQANQYWSMDFVSDRLETGNKYRALTMVDVFTRECLSIHPGKHLKADHVVDVLDRLIKKRTSP